MPNSGAPEAPAMPDPMIDGGASPMMDGSMPAEGNDPMMGVDPGMGTMQPTGDAQNPYDANFDAGVEADEESDPKKYIQQLTGKLSQSLRKYNEGLPQPDADLDKYVAGMIVKQCIEGLPQEDVQEILDKVNTDEQEQSMNNGQDMQQSMDQNMQPQPNQQPPMDNQQPMPQMNEGSETGRNPQPIDQPSNTHYAVNRQNKLIVNAWEYGEYDPSELRQFAKDYFTVDLEDYGFNPKEYKILTRKGCMAQGIDPSKNENWSNDGVTPCKSQACVNENVARRQAITSRYEEFTNDKEDDNDDKVTNRNSYHKSPWVGKTFKS